MQAREPTVDLAALGSEERRVTRATKSLPMGHTHRLRHLGPGVKAILIYFCDEKWGERHLGKPRKIGLFRTLRAHKSERRESGGRNTSQGPSYGS
jgi:hypothetical protein